MFVGYFTERPYQDPSSGYFARDVDRRRNHSLGRGRLHFLRRAEVQPDGLWI